MNHNKKFIAGLFAIVTIHAMTHSAHRGSFSYITSPLRPVIKTHLQKIKDLPAAQTIHRYTQSAKQTFSKMYAPFEHPYYTKFIEPQYVGHKSHIWGDQMQEYWHNMMLSAHDHFAEVTYSKWKKSLNYNQKMKYQSDMHRYEQAYYTYKMDPTNQEAHQELLNHAQHMHELMIHTRPSPQERIQRVLFDHEYM